MEPIDPELIGQLIHQTARLWRHKLDQRLHPLGLSQAKWRTLAMLAHGHLTQRDLAERLGIEEPTLARSLVSMENGGWIKREPARHDRRCKTVHLQRKSSAILQRIEQTAQGLRHELVETIPMRDLQTCLQVLSEIRSKAVEVSGESSNGKNGHSKKKTRKPAK